MVSILEELVGFAMKLFIYRVVQKECNTYDQTFQKMRDRMKKRMCALLCITFFPQQDDTKIINSDEGVLILRPVLYKANVIFKICPSISKITIDGLTIFHCLASPDIVTAPAL